jgi:hypothetical protein
LKCSINGECIEPFPFPISNLEIARLPVPGSRKL